MALGMHQAMACISSWLGVLVAYEGVSSENGSCATAADCDLFGTLAHAETARLAQIKADWPRGVCMVFMRGTDGYKAIAARRSVVLTHRGMKR